ncbi:hypothetical protein SUDANB6_05356 [Streptomyces sp. enrichment culture]
MSDVSHELVEHVSWSICARRRGLNSPWRRLGCFEQALLALTCLRKNETFAQLAAGFGVSTATARRYVDETDDGHFGCMNSYGSISTCFRPSEDPMRYFQEQFT